MDSAQIDKKKKKKAEKEASAALSSEFMIKPESTAPKLDTSK